jgi:hypothetical protein
MTTEALHDAPQTVAPPRETLTLFAFSYLIGLVMLMTAGIYEGPLAEPALAVVLVALGLVVVLYVRALRHRPLLRPAPRWALVVVAVALGVFAVATFADARLLIHGLAPPRLIHVIEVAQFGLLATYVPSLLKGTPDRATWATLRFACFAVMFVAGGVSVIYVSPHPAVDVWDVHMAGARALLHGLNPYDIANVHVPDQSSGNSPIAFLYPPTPCYANTIAYALGGDVRWGPLTALTTAGVAMRLIARRRAGLLSSPMPSLLEDAPALLVWLTPKAYFFLEVSWNDAYPLAFAALTVLAHAFGRRYLSAFFLGVLLSAKQTMIWFLPLGLLLGFTLTHWLVVFAAGAAALAPFVIWDFHGLKYWTVDHFLGYPPRPEALSPMAWLTRHFGVVQGKTPPGFILAAAASCAAAWRAPRTRYAFAVAATVACFCFYLFNRFMCMNYYFFVTGLSALAAAASVGEWSPEIAHAPVASRAGKGEEIVSSPRSAAESTLDPRVR